MLGSPGQTIFVRSDGKAIEWMNEANEPKASMPQHLSKENRQERHFFKSVSSSKSFNKRYNKSYEAFAFLHECQIQKSYRNQL